jgi:nucleoside-diphosphate-sugar epimerase
MIQRIFITGAAGFIGSNLVKGLIERGYTVGIIIRDSTSTTSLETSLGKIRLYRGDIRDGKCILSCITDFSPDAIIHLATYYAVEHSPDDVGIMVDTNVRGTISILESARHNNIKLVINTSTCAVYEQKDHPLSEDDDVSPQNLYAVTKLQAEEACRFYALNYNVDAVSLRLFPPYGPGDHERRLIPYIIRMFHEGIKPDLTTGKQKWDFLYIDDIVSAYCAVLEAYPLKNPYEIFNIGTGNAVSIRDIVQMIMKMMDRQIQLTWGTIPHRKNEVWFNSADTKKAETILGWKPVTQIADGLKKTIDWFTKDREKLA